MSAYLGYVLRKQVRCCEFTGAPYLEIDVRPLVDGQPLLAAERDDEVFDAVEFLLADEQSDSVELLTCECGVAECAGITAPVSVRLGPDHVRWSFPARVYRQRLAGPAGLEHEFNRAQYDAARRQLVDELDELSQNSTLPMVVTPSSGPESSLSRPSFKKQLAQARARRAAWRQVEVERAAAEGELRQLHIDALTPEGALRRASLASLAWLKMAELEFLDLKAELAHLRDVVAPGILRDPVKALLELPGEEWAHLFRVVLIASESEEGQDWFSHPGLRFELGQGGA